MRWDEVAGDEIATLGYILEMLQDDDTWTVVSNQRSNPNALSAKVSGLTSGKKYSFRVFAADFNGLSDSSPVVDVYACGLPRRISEPTYVYSDTN